jgi:hypothetical protein
VGPVVASDRWIGECFRHEPGVAVVDVVAVLPLLYSAARWMSPVVDYQAV